jgi:uncharacterized UPF0160 family protein
LFINGNAVGVNMQTIQLDIADDKLDTFLTIVENLQKDIVQGIRLKDNGLDIEPIEKEGQDFIDIQLIKQENNPKYSIEEAKAKLGL